jgi:hypothetical protein
VEASSAAKSGRLGPGVRRAWRAICLALCTSVTLLGSARADASGPRLVVLRNDVARTELSGPVDRALLTALEEQGRFGSTYVSPTPFEDIRLAAGCEGRTTDCVQRIATTLAADWVLVRELRRDDAGRVVLQLVAQDGPAASTRRAEARVAKAGSPEQVVAQLVSELYASAEPAQASAPALSRNDDASELHRPAKVVGFTLLASSGALLASGAVLGIISRQDLDRYARTEVVDAASAEHAQSLLDDARHRSRVANALFASGGVTALTGTSILIWRRTRMKREALRVTMNLLASPRLAGLQVRGTFEGVP